VNNHQSGKQIRKWKIAGVPGASFEQQQILYARASITDQPPSRATPNRQMTVN